MHTKTRALYLDTIGLVTENHINAPQLHACRENSFSTEEPRSGYAMRNTVDTFPSVSNMGMDLGMSMRKYGNNTGAHHILGMGVISSLGICITLGATMCASGMTMDWGIGMSVDLDIDSDTGIYVILRITLSVSSMGWTQVWA